MQQMHRQHGGQPLQIKAFASASFAQLAPSKRTEPADHRILDPHRCLKCEIIRPVEGYLPNLPNEGSIEREREERRRCSVTHPKWSTGIDDMSLAIREGARLYMFAFNRAPVHLKGFALMYCHYYLRRREIPALDRPRCATS